MRDAQNIKDLIKQVLLENQHFFSGDAAVQIEQLAFQIHRNILAALHLEEHEFVEVVVETRAHDGLLPHNHMINQCCKCGRINPYNRPKSW